MLACPGSPLPLHPSVRTPALWLWWGESRARAGQGLLGARSSLGVCVKRVGALWDCGGGWEVGGDRWGFIQSPPWQSQAVCVVGSVLSLQCSVTSVTASHAPSYPLQWRWAVQQTLGCRKTAGPSAPGRAAFSQHPRMCSRESTLPLPRLLCARGQALPTPGAASHDARPPLGIRGPVLGPSSNACVLVDVCPGRCLHLATQRGTCCL